MRPSVVLVMFFIILWLIMVLSVRTVERRGREQEVRGTRRWPTH